MTKTDLEKIASDFFKYLDPEAKIEVQENDGFKVKVDCPNSGGLIGKFGETLNDIQHVLRLMVAKSAGEFIPVTVDIAGYKESRENELIEFAKQMAENVRKSGYAQEMRPMNSYDRRLVHVALKDFEGIKAEAIGEGEERRIKIEKAE
jgi:spoIIIJ-associated protein